MAKPRLSQPFRVFLIFSSFFFLTIFTYEFKEVFKFIPYPTEDVTFEKVNSVPMASSIQHPSDLTKPLPEIAKSVVIYPNESYPNVARATLLLPKRLSLDQSLMVARAIKTRFDPQYRALSFCLTANPDFYNVTEPMDDCYLLVEYTGAGLARESVITIQKPKPYSKPSLWQWLADLFKQPDAAVRDSAQP